MSRLIIFDFDGVLADSLKVVFEMNQKAVARIGKTLTLEEYCACFEGHINQGLAKLYDLDDNQKKDLVDFKATLYPEHYNAKTVKLFSFAKELIHEASVLGELWIVSSSPVELITDILKSNGLVQYFTKIVGQNRQPKNIFFQSELSDNSLRKVFFITDTTGDMKEIKKANVNVAALAVTWGFHTDVLLQIENPALLVYKPEEIINYIKEY